MKIFLISVMILLLGCSQEPILDEKAGLMWEYETQFHISYSEAQEYCKNLSQGGFDNWRFSNAAELKTLKENNILKGLEKKLAIYWSSDVNEKGEIQVVSFGYEPYLKKSRVVPKEMWTKDFGQLNDVRCVRYSFFKGY